MVRDYHTFMLSDEPKLFGVPITTGLPVFCLTGIGLVIGMATQLFLIGAALSTLMHVKFGDLPIRGLFAIVYWSLPRRFTKALFKSLPNSAHRLYLR